MDTVKLHSSVRITVNGPMKVKKADMQLDENKKLVQVTPRWHGKKNRIDIKVGRNVVPASILDWPAIQKLQAKGLITIDSSGLKGEAKKVAKAKTVKAEPKVEVPEEESLPAAKPAKKPTKKVAK